MPCCPLDSAVASFLQALRNISISAGVVVQPRLTRTAPRVSGGETPMAARTWEGCTLPDEQAAPDDTAVHRVRAEVNQARAAAERSVMAQGVFRWAARESRRACQE